MFIRRQNPARILGIDPGTHEMGYALLEGNALLYHGVEVFSNRSSPEVILAAGREKLRRLIRDYRPSIVAIEKTFLGRYRNTAILHVFVDELRRTARKERLPVVEIPAVSVRKVVTGHGWVSKERLARVLAGMFPELRPYVFGSGSPRWQRLHHANATDAIAVAVAVSQKPALV